MAIQINHKHIKSAIDLVKKITPEYNLFRGAHDGYIVSVDRFLDFCQSRAKIDVYDHPTHTWTPNSPLPRAGFLSKHNNEYEIFILPSQKFCWSRFVLCKELFHVLLDVDDQEKIFSHSNIDSHVEQYMYSHFPSTTLNIQSEFLAEIAAMEFLFPHSFRVAQSNSSSEALAEQYKIPKQMVERFMRDDLIKGLSYTEIEIAAADEERQND